VPNLSDISVIKELLRRHGFTFSKALGQHFLVNPSVCPRMAEACGTDENTGVLEIGAGIGVLTAELAQTAKKVVSLELDARLLPVLAETLAGCGNVEVLRADVLKTDLPELLRTHFGDMPVVVCANLPYYISSPVIMALLESRLPLESLTLMLQKEAAERICAPVGSRESGAVTVAVSYYAQTKKLFPVSAGSFLPAPKVDSLVIRLDVRRETPVSVPDEAFFFRVVRAAFGQRRKTAANAIAAGLGLPKSAVAAALESAGIAPSARAEELSLEAFAALSGQLRE